MADALTDLFAVAIVESKTDDVAPADEAGIIVEVNDLMCRLCGFTRDELLGASLDVLIPERSRRAHRHYRRGYMLHPSARPMGPDREVVLLHKSGREIRVWIGLAPMDEHNVTCVVLPMDIGRSYGLAASTTHREDKENLP